MLFLAPVNAQASPQTTFPSAAITAAVDDAVARYDLPGIAVGVVVDGEVRQWEVRGETVAGSGERVGRDTLFKVASNTKAMTAALLARQVDAGLLAWDDPVVKHLPGFRMYEDWVTREMQVRDLLIHNSGMGPGAGDLMLWPEPNRFTRDDVIAGLAYLKPRWSFRSRYAYDNTLYIVAGEVAAAVGGAPYDVLLQREVFEPLGMDACRIGEWRVADAGSVASPHVKRQGNWVARQDGEVVTDMPMAAAGGVRCSLDSMLRWTKAWLAEEVNSPTYAWLSAQQRAAMWTPHTPMPLPSRMRKWNGSHFYAYGYGWRLSDVDGTAKVAHTGTLSGMYSAVTLLPELDTGFVILINGEAGEARTVLEQVLTKQFTGPGEKRTVAHYAEDLARENAERASTVAEDAADVTTADARASARRSAASPDQLVSWLGKYRDPWFGDVSICTSDAGVRFESANSPRLSGPVLDGGGRWLVDFDTLESDADAWLDFANESADGRTQLTMAKVDPHADFSYDYEDLSFQRIGECARR
ncbi:serine hydrolase domain-containing protein [Novilysobacter antarcticus]|uniref:serine hydrolase domain-containing protein n=1 Tax=Novilysobacter antarcticus TaxID=2862543 RepID=UPI0031BB98D4